MKKIWITSFFCLGLMVAHAQKGWNFGLSYHKTSISDKIEDLPYFRDRLESGTGFGVLLSKRFSLKNNFEWSVGFGYDRASYALNKNDLRWPSQIDPETGLIPLHISTVEGALGNIFGKRTFNSLSIPIMLHTTVKDFGFGRLKVRTGLIPKHFLSRSNVVEVDMTDEVSDLKPWMRDVTLDALIGIELQVAAGDNFAVTLIPSLRTEVFSSSLNNSDHRVRFASLGLEIGM